jgi:hypothetical protein
MFAMNRLNLGLWIVSILLGIAHITYFALTQQQPYGAYFAKGLSVYENGDTFAEHSRLQIQKNRVYDFQQSGDWTRFFSLKVKDNIFGSLELSSISEVHTPVRPATVHDDNELDFNQAYYSKEDTPVTLYRLPTGQDQLCVYIRELHKLRCLGMSP